MAVAGCLVTLALEQAWQSLTQAVMSLAIPGHTRSVVMSCLVARGVPGHGRQQLSKEMTGQGRWSEVSHRILRSLNETSFKDRLESFAASVLGQSRWAPVMAA